MLSEKGAILADVRSKEEFAEDNFNGSINVPVDEFECMAADPIQR